MDDTTLDKLIDLSIEHDVDLDELIKGTDHEMEHTKDPMESAKFAITHLKEVPDYYTKLQTIDHAETSDHQEIHMSTADLRASGLVSAMGVGISADRTLSDIPPKDIHQDVRGELAMKRDEPIYSENDTDDPELDSGDWVQAFKAGTFADSDGVVHKWEPKDIDTIAQQYNKAVEPSNPERHIAPVVVGHPKDDSPAYGWIDKAKAVGGKLYLKMSQLQPEFVDAVKRGLYKTRSISLYPDLNIRHLGFLGGSPPAVKGLASHHFQEAPVYSTYEFGENMEDVNELKTENKFFKRLFNLFKIDVSNYKEGTSKDLQSTDVPQIKTTTGKYPEGATMAEISKADHLKYAESYIGKMKSYIAGISGTDISSHKEKTDEFARLAMHHMGHIKETKVPDEDAGDSVKLCSHLERTHAELKALVAGNLSQPPAVGTPTVQPIIAAVAHAEPETTKVADHAELPPETKAIPTTEIKNDKDKISELEAELTKLKDAISVLSKENEKLLAGMAEEQKENAMGQYSEFCEKLIGEGKLKPTDKAIIVENFRLRSEQDKVNNFSENDPKRRNFVEEYKAYLTSQPAVVEMSELITGKAPATPSVNASKDFVETEIANVMKVNSRLQYHEAFRIVSQTHPDKVASYVESGFNG